MSKQLELPLDFPPASSYSVIDNSNKPCIAVDFDGTICDHEFPNVGNIKHGVKEALQSFRDLGYLILIYSCRSCHWHYELFGQKGVPVPERPAVKAMKQFLDENQIPYDEIDDGSRGKPLASFYIDDKAVRFQDNWPQIQAFVEAVTDAG